MKELQALVSSYFESAVIYQKLIYRMELLQLEKMHLFPAVICAA